MKQTFAIIGVDGSGKSTLISQLGQRFGEKAMTQYMGSVRFEDERIEIIKNKQSLSVYDSIRLYFLIYKCFWDRYKTATKSNKLVLFDRYVDERYINAKGKYRFLNVILYKYFFPKPSHIIYLHCSAETSFNRKSDIPDKSAFIAMKERFDEFYMKGKSNLCLSSDDSTPGELSEIAYNYILKESNGRL